MMQNTNRIGNLPNLELPECDALLKRLYALIPRPARVATVSAFLIGLLTHLFVMMNYLPNHDGLVSLFTRNDMTASGRWFLFVPSALSGRINVPWINTLLALIALSITCALVVQLLQIKKPLWAVLTSAVIVTFPSVPHTFAYMFTADAYFIGVLLAAFGAFLVEKHRFGFLLGGGLIGLAIGTYQAYVFFALSLIGMRGVLLLLDQETPNRQIWIKLLQYIGALAIACAAYKVGLEVMLWYRDTELNTYQGIDALNEFNLLAFFVNTPRAYNWFLTCYHQKSTLFLSTLQRMALWGSTITVVLSTVISVVREKLSWFRYALVFLILLGAPLMFGGIWIFTSFTHELMLLPMCLIYVFAIAMYENLPPVKEQTAKRTLTVLLGYALAFVMATASIQGAWYANRAYLGVYLKYEQAYAFANRLVDRIEQTPGYTHDTPVYFGDAVSLEMNYEVVQDWELRRIMDGVALNSGSWSTMLFEDAIIRLFLRDCLGRNYVAPDTATIDAILQSEAYQAVPDYPAAESVQMLDGVIVVKLCDAQARYDWRVRNGYPTGKEPD